MLWGESKVCPCACQLQQANRFCTAAQEAVAEASTAAELAKPLQDLASLRAWVTEVHDDIPSRDQSTYATALEQLNTDLLVRRAALSKAKGKFSFKRTAPARPNATTSASAKPGNQGGALCLPIQLARPTRRWEHREAETLSASDPALAGSGDLHLTDLEKCVVDLRGLQGLKAVFIRQVRRSVVVMGSVDGSVLLHGCDATLIAVDCRQVRRSSPDGAHALTCSQYRMHDSVGCVCLLATQGTITIEGCRQLRIGRLPGCEDLGEMHVQDFDHVAHLTCSPNWKLCEDGAAILEDGLSYFAQGRTSKEEWQSLLTKASR